jgi:hypothetical protein
LPLAVGDFALNASPTIISLTSAPQTQVTASLIGGLTEPITLSCVGLPASVSCSAATNLYPSVPSTSLTVSTSSLSSLAPADYPFQIIGTATVLSHSVNATLRVSSFTASLNQTTASIKNGGSATFGVVLNSVNHFSGSNIAVLCSSVAGVTCTTLPTNQSLTDGGTTTAELTVTYTAPGTVAASSENRGFGAIILACAVVLIVPTRRRRNTWRAVIWILVAAALIVPISACGGGGSGGGGGGGGGVQTISVAITAQAPVASGNLVQSAGTITLTVTR